MGVGSIISKSKALFCLLPLPEPVLEAEAPTLDDAPGGYELEDGGIRTGGAGAPAPGGGREATYWEAVEGGNEPLLGRYCGPLLGAGAYGRFGKACCC
jgi:hypothetical protein